MNLNERLERLISDFSEQQATDWVARKFETFDPSGARPLAADETKNEKEFFKGARVLGHIRTLPETAGSDMNRPVLVAAVEMKKLLMERTSRQVQFAFAKKVLQNAVREGASGLDGYPSQGLFFFYDKDQFFRMSLVSGDVENRRFKFNEAKRQSFYVHPDKPNNVLKSRLCGPIGTFAALKEAFSVETLTKEFYRKLFEWYEWAMAPRTGVTFPNDVQDDSDGRQYNNEAIIRLITQLMFVWFIRQRDLVPAALFTVDGVKGLLKSFAPTSMDADNYYQAILQNLFFATLNSPIEKRDFISARRYKGTNSGYLVKTLFRHAKEFKDPAAFKGEVMASVPFLNCALFDCLDKQDHETGRLMLFDGFSENPKRQAHVPNGLFFHPERGIIPLFDQYEFTIDENNADDADVALDPELLGKVFENLLGAFNPETQETARKATGSFYTPREIVDYMVAESLKNHIKTRLGKAHPAAKVDAWLQDLFDPAKAVEGADLPFGEDVRKEIAEALYTCKILDPACGSGAFPMGVLHAMVRLFRRLDPNNTDLNDRLLKRYSEDKRKILEGYCSPEESEEWLETLKLQLGESQRFPDYARKLYLIENCIHGIDIQPIACQISKLRFFISLLCDQLRTNFNRDAKNNGLLSLPNLEAKFVCANTLISLPKVEDSLALGSQEIAALREKLQTNRHNIFRARTYLQKERYRAKDEAIRDQIKAMVKEQLGHPDEELIRVEREVVAKLQRDRLAVAEPKMQKVKKPVQGDLFGGASAAPAYETVDVNKPKRDQIDAQIVAAERTIATELKKASSKNAEGIDQLANLIASWDPYDQNKVSPFFDLKWMFNMDSGFDIVIGNPPYVLIDKEEYTAKYAHFFKYQSGKIDLYRLFIEKAFTSLAANAGAVVSYITPNTFLAIPSCKALRQYLLQEHSFERIVNYDENVFDGVSVNNVVSISRIGKADADHVISVSPKGNVNDLYPIRQADCLGNEDFSIRIFQNAQTLIVLRKMTASGRTIGEIGLDICLGEQPYHNTIHTKKQMDSRFLHADHKVNASYLQELGGRDISKYSVARNRQIYLDYSAELYTKPPTRYFCGERIIIREIPRETLVCAYAKEKFLVNKSCYVLKNTMPEISYMTLLAILNSRIIGFWISNSGEKTQQNLFPRISMASLKAIPLPQVAPKDNEKLTILTEKVVDSKAKDPSADTLALEAEIDRLVYKLYGLTPEEIAIVEGKGDEKAKAVVAEPKQRRVGKARPAARSAAIDEDLE